MRKFTLLFSAILCLAGLWQGHAQNGGVDCDNAVTVTPGSITGALITDTGGTNNTGDAIWYLYSPAESGTITISSCGNATGMDTRLFLLSGTCDALVNEDNDDDGCDAPVGLNSLLEDASVVAGTNYYIQWTDRWAGSEDTAFDWTLDFVPAPDCANPDPSVDSTTDVSAEVSWDLVPNVDNYDWEVVPSGNDQGDGVVDSGNTTEGMASITGLAPEVEYDFLIKSDCETEYAAPVTFTTNATPPANDACVDATEVTAFPYTFTQEDAAGATNNDGAIIVTDCGSGMNDGVWYTLTGDGNEITVTVTPDAWDCELGIYSGDCGTFVCVDNADSGLSGGAEEITFTSEVGTSYYINVGHWSTFDNVEDAFDISITSEEIVEPSGCDQTQVSNAFENGLFNEAGGAQMVADDFIVSINTINFSVSSLNLNIFTQGGMDSVDLVFYDDNNGIPGAELETVSGIVPTSQEVIGQMFGFDIHETIIDFDTPIDFPGTGMEEVTYWMQVTVTPTVAGTQTAWESTTASIIGNQGVFDNDAVDVWTPTGEDFVFSIIGDCELVDGCLAVENLTVTDIDDTSATISWDDSPTATDGYILEGYFAGDDPDTDPTQFDATIAAGTLTYDATGLNPDTAYDVYVTADCGDEQGFTIMETFMTAPTPPDNDDACDAIALTVDAECTGAIYTSIAATVEDSEPEGDCFFGGPQFTVWFTFEAPDNGSVVITTDLDSGVATHTDTEIALYSAPTDCTDLSTFDPALACDQDSGDVIIFNSIIEAEGLTPGETYYVQVSGWNGNNGTFCIEVQTGPDCPEVENFAVAGITETAADFSWDPLANADNGYQLTVFAAGTTTDPIVDEAIAAGTTTYSTGDVFLPGTPYDAYLVADCDAGGLSEAVTLSFTTLFPDALPEECDGQFVDSGNTNGNYSANEVTTTVLTPDDGTSVSITFTYVDIESATGAGTQDGCWDYLTIYDGSDTSAPVIAETLCGEESGDGGVPSVPTSLLSVGDSFEATNPDGTLTIVFTSDGTVQETGWLADITCAPLAIEDFTFANFNYHPNPTTGILNVNAKSAIESIELYNILGQQVLQLRPDALDAVLDLTDLSSGTYMMKSTVNGNSYTHKVIKD
ncbi:fibronectin type III domain-containing protein [Cochleicola gelatinilyticus]|uniref:Fibronectin type-III domain-containing protein n=1 Tax=Cochleicola gelatinilyticus TaxID=1763537 RepID=A0A167HFF1_9FLAO|nr:fibronectin type III domain-containing protein [Cochleicola gelatinilyticus]OAB78546.1 hypothetical protein ULVI_08115 [Cochleicola gelatinilyticus]